jgi:uncharacterized protein involved in type VI secretion and phage assembly
MKLFEMLEQTASQQVRSDRICGVVIGMVTNNQDPNALGRVKIKFPWLSDNDESTWARLAGPMAGKQRGIYFLPEVGDEVLVAFDHGDLRFPYVLGALWNGKDTPPVTNDGGKNDIRIIKSRSGHVIKLNDEDGKETIEIMDKTGKNSIIIDTAKNAITITTDKDITLSATKGTIKLDAQKVEINSSDATKLKATGTMNVETSATMTVKGSTVNIN